MASVSSKGGTPASIPAYDLSARADRRRVFQPQRLLAKTSNRGKGRVKIIVSAQNTFFTDNLSCAASGHWVINGSYLKCIDSDDHATFIGYTQTEIEDSLVAYFDGLGLDRANTTGNFMLDMEGPNNQVDTFANASGLWRASESVADEIAVAWKTRMRAVKAVLPKATISMYATPQPGNRGVPTSPVWLDRIAALQRVGGPGSVGLYDDLDYLSPLVFVQYGPTDDDYSTITAMTEQGVTAARTLLRTDGSELPQLPLTAPVVFNAVSAHDNEYVLDFDVADPIADTIKAQVDVLAAQGVPNLLFWVGGGNTQLIQTAVNASGWTVNDYTVHLNTLMAG